MFKLELKRVKQINLVRFCWTEIHYCSSLKTGFYGVSLARDMSVLLWLCLLGILVSWVWRCWMSGEYGQTSYMRVRAYGISSDIDKMLQDVVGYKSISMG